MHPKAQLTGQLFIRKRLHGVIFEHPLNIPYRAVQRAQTLNVLGSAVDLIRIKSLPEKKLSDIRLL